MEMPPTKPKRESEVIMVRVSPTLKAAIRHRAEVVREQLGLPPSFGMSTWLLMLAKQELKRTGARI